MAVHVRYEGAVAVVTLDRVKSLNALDRRLITEIGAAIDEVERSSARCVVFVGAGDKAFCAGADIEELRDIDEDTQRRAAHFGQSVFAKLDGLSIPSVAAIHGFALGGGLELAMACTFRVATASAKMGLPEIKLGLIPGYGGTQRLPRLVGAARATELIATGRIVGAEEAYRIGLVNMVGSTETAIDLAYGFMKSFIDLSASSIMTARLAVQAAGRFDLAQGLAAEADLVARVSQTPDAREGIEAFRLKRKPIFNSPADVGTGLE